MESYIKKNFVSQPKSFIDKSSLTAGTTELYRSYNLLLYTFPEFHRLYESIREIFHELNTTNEGYYIQCWLNYYYKGDHIDWHGHWSVPNYENCWHGFYCVDCEEVESHTRYRMIDTSEEFEVKSENDLLIISKSDNDIHRTFPWQGENPRITIAFDIVQGKYIDNYHWTNHWIPI
jgi:hypothetical protein